MGATVHRGSLDDLECLHSGAAAADGTFIWRMVHHLAFIHDFYNFANPVTTDQRAVEAMGATLIYRLWKALRDHFLDFDCQAYQALDIVA